MLYIDFIWQFQTFSGWVQSILHQSWTLSQDVFRFFNVFQHFPDQMFHDVPTTETHSRKCRCTQELKAINHFWFWGFGDWHIAHDSHEIAVLFFDHCYSYHAILRLSSPHEPPAIQTCLRSQIRITWDSWTAEALNWVIAIFLKYMSPVAYVLTGNAPGNEAMGLVVKIKRADWWCRCLKVQHGSTPYIMANTDSFVA